MLEGERLLAEQLAPPTGERGYVGLVVSGDAVEVVDGGDDFGGDAVPFGGHAQQHLEELHGGLAIDRGPRAFEPRQALRVSGKSSLDRRDDRLAPSRALEAPGQ